MPNDQPRGFKAFTGSTKLSGSAKGHFGDVYEHGTKYNIQHHHHYGPSASLTAHKLLTNHAHGQYINSTGKGLALLSFDGGPFGGLAHLFVLKRFMERVARIQALPQPPKPCEFFDVISGAGVGGLLAILLGSFELTIDQCIEEYLCFSENVLDKPTLPGDDIADSNPHPRCAIFDQMAVERFVKRILRDRHESEDRLLQAPSALSCKVFLKVAHHQGGYTEIWRSYQTQTPDDYRLRYVKLWQAVQATLATSPWFHPVVIDTGEQSIVYSTRTSLQDNSLQDVFAEAQTHLLDGSQALPDHLDCLVSVGSMIHADSTQTGLTSHFLSALADVYSANKVAHLEFDQSHMSMSSSGQICRLEMPLELNYDTRWPSEDQTRLARAAERYLDSTDTADRLRPCFARLSQHQLAPGFAVMQEPQRQFEVSTQSRTLPQPDQISSYNARLSHYRRSQPRVRDTCTWILKNPTFIQWCQAPWTSALICTGTVGCGKSFLAAAIIDHMQELQLNTHRGYVHYFFETGSNLPSALQELLRAFIKQLVASYDNMTLTLHSGISTALHNTFRTDRLPPSTDKLIDLLKMLIDSSPPSLYLIDGFDDLDEPELLDMFKILRLIFADRNPHGSKLVLICREILGRGIDIERQLTGISQVHSVRLRLADLSKDIAKFVEAQVNEQQLRRIITANEGLIEEVKKKLISHSEKMFLWIHFQIQTIWDPRLSKNDDEIRALIKNLPDGLDKTYEACLRRIESHDDHKHYEIAMKAFRWVSAAKAPLTPRQAREVVSMSKSRVQLPESEILNAPVTDYCDNLLTTDITNRRVQFTHASVKQFLESSDKIPADLSRYHLKPEHAARECVALCLTYIDAIKSRRQMIIQQRGANIAYHIPKVIESGLSTSSKMATMARLFMGKSSKTNFGTEVPASAWSPPDAEFAKLDMHEYFVKNWLSHASDMDTSDPKFDIFRRLCSMVDPELFPWLYKATESNTYQQLAQYSVVNRHLPLLHVVKESLKGQPSLLRSVFNSYCPGTDAGLAHMAAALGYTDVLQALPTICDVDAYDGLSESRTPLAWAAEKSHFEAVGWLLVTKRARVQDCIKVSNHRIPLVTILAGLDSDEGYWKFSALVRAFAVEENYLSQALFAACTKGHARVAEHLTVHGARACCNTEDFGAISFYWPGLGVCREESLMDVAMNYCSNRALEVLASMMRKDGWEGHCERHGYEGEMRRIIGRILSLTPRGALPMCEFLCIPETMLILVKHETWHTMIREVQYRYGSKWNEVVRRILYAQLALDHSPPVPSELLTGYQDWTLTPDDLLVALLRLGYIQLNDDQTTDTAYDRILAEGCLLRRSSRVFLVKRDIVIAFPSWCRLGVPLFALEGFRQYVKSLSVDTVEAVIYQLHQSPTCSIDTLELFEQQPLIRVLLEGSGLQPFSEILRQPWTLTLSLNSSITQLFHLARCYRICRQDGERARRMYEDLKDISDNYDVSLNFPFGYMKINNRYVVKISILGAIYRWNYRIRRRKNLPFSAADVAYAKAVGLPIPEESQTTADI